MWNDGTSVANKYAGGGQGGQGTSAAWAGGGWAHRQVLLDVVEQAAAALGLLVDVDVLQKAPAQRPGAQRQGATWRAGGEKYRSGFERVHTDGWITPRGKGEWGAHGAGGAETAMALEADA